MKLYNSRYFVEIVELEYVDSELINDNKIDRVFDYNKPIDSKFSKSWKLSINDSISHYNIILTDHVVASCSCILLEEELIILLDGYIAVLDLKTYEIMVNDNLENHGCFFAIYEYNDGYIIHGELEIIKLFKDFNIEWSFSGSDIFVRVDGSKCFEIIDDKIVARCWDGLDVLLDSRGNVITENYNK